MNNQSFHYNLDLLKQKADLISVISKQVRLKKFGKSFSGHCPFHNDKNPSLLVNPEKNLWCCLGACKKGGSIIDWVMVSENVGIGQPLEF